MRWLRLSLALIRAKFRSKLNPSGTSLLPFRVWITDIDVAIMNHAALLSVMETGRIDFMVRTGFFKIAMANKWYFPVQAISVQFFRPLRFLQKGVVVTKIAHMGEEWFYLEQKITSKGKDVAICLVKGKIKKGKMSIPTDEIIRELNFERIVIEKKGLIESFENANQEMTIELVGHTTN